MSFTNDERVLGKWEAFDVVQSETQLKTKTGKGAFKEIYFLSNGGKYWIFEGWTKGILFTHFGGNEPIIKHEYELKNINDQLFMFLKTENNKDINVLVKTSNKIYELFEIGRRDNIALPFVFDEKIIGKWSSVAWVHNISDFTGNKTEKSGLWLKSIQFSSDGTSIREYDSEEWRDTWTEGFLIDKEKSTTSAYIIKNINGSEYLFLEWKMGNYVYGGAAHDYYVFERN